jgi:ATP-dependent helicase/nuclease subunit A
VSVWLHANAGSGKTKVLIDRVARLLLAGVAPQQVLCLTYTKAAAAEMQNRLFAQLGAWAMKPDAELATELAALEPQIGPQIVPPTGAPDLALARQLFARAIETPGGLRIQTIHSFCATLLRRFPLEAGVSPQFQELDDRTARLMRADIAEEIALYDSGAVMARVARADKTDNLDDFLGQIAGQRAGLQSPLSEADIWQVFDLRPGETQQTLLAEVMLGGEMALIEQLLPALDAGSITDKKAANRLREILHSAPGTALLPQLESLFLNASGLNAGGPRITHFPTQDTRERVNNLLPELHEFMGRVAAARPRRLALIAAEKTAALHGFAARFVPEYDRQKAVRGVLDFDDMIMRAGALLSDPSVAQWVLYRLDGGIDHILVDEAQDTAPRQWYVLQRLTEAFLDGDGAERGRGGAGLARTVFVVGDKKQSIYSFQGADVAAFDTMKAQFRTGLARTGPGLREQDMVHSFRSSPAILAAVDATFDRPQTDSVGGRMQHVAYFDTRPGRVEMWPVIPKTPVAEDPDPTDPVDRTTDEHHTLQLGRKTADWIAAQLEQGLQVPGRHGPRPATPGDFLVLVQKRGPLFSAIIAMCKKRGLAIAGADRMKLGEELAVKDLLALLSFLAMDSDDLALATVLRSPLGGLTEAQLYALAYSRKESLWLTLLKARAAWPALVDMLDDLRRATDILRPYDLLERMLTRHRGRQRLLGRLGREAEDAIDELLTQALAYETTEVPSLTGFLTWLDAGEIAVKRQMETDGGQIRVMTVHGAKGLEAPVVILPDTADRSSDEKTRIFAMGDGPVVWATVNEESPPQMLEARNQSKHRRQAENDRLLYVAMTRAQSLLVIAAAGEVKEKDKDKEKEKYDPCWYLQMRDGLQRAGAKVQPDGGLLLTFGSWPPPKKADTASPPPVTLPDWALTQAPNAPRLARPIVPSALGGAKALPGEAGQDHETATARGDRLHLLLEHLPQAPVADWPGLAAALGAEDMLAEAKAVLAAHPALFGPGTLAEVAITAELAGTRMAGKIDRLILSEGRVLAVDYKSNQVVPQTASEVPEGILRQMGAYAAALGQIYPDRQIDVAILWTRTAELLHLHPDIVRAALARALPIDVATPAA